MSKFPSREESLFTEALAQPPAHRSAFLAAACHDDLALLARVATLLAAHDGPESLHVPGAVARLAIAGEQKPGDRIGPYKLLQKIGEGGCGVVFLAEQEKPVRRRVALKVIKLGMDTREVIARFEAERQALAMMEHPNIATVLDAGATENGRPYFVMELVRGVSITRFCDDHNLPTRDRLELFIQVCHAIQHAHQKGIIHRDIKPSNILVELHDTIAVPKVIDFGIAKATQGRLTDQTLFTALEQFIGTPAYMSPEQAQLSGLDIDTRSDVYSLGVLLYELLTGRTPFDANALLKAGLDEVRRHIREVDPPKPSTRLVTLEGEGLTTTAQLRQTKAPKLVNFIKGDLDWIAMRCLEKDRTRRYESANALAVDLQHFVQDEPVSARPPSPWYVLQKVVRRHRVAMVGAGVFLLVVGGGTVASAWQIVRTERVKNEMFAGEVRNNVMRYAIRTSLEVLMTPPSRDENRPGDLTVRAALEHASRRFSAIYTGDIFHAPAEIEVSPRGTIALGFLALGDPGAALPHAERALTAARALANEAKPADPLARQQRVREALGLLVQLYRRWDATEPGTGKSALVASWQQKLDEYNRAHPAPTTLSDRRTQP